MKHENKRQQYQAGYYKTHPCRDSFPCRVCGRLVTPDGAGSSHRNHCPNCLYSLHVDITPGDRAADCGGIMEPVAVWVRKNGEWALIHRCRHCGALSANRVAADDNPMKLMSIALSPLCAPPFPLERIEELAACMGGRRLTPPLHTQIPYLHPQKPFPSCTCCERNGFLFFAEGHMTGHGRSGSQCWLCR